MPIELVRPSKSILPSYLEALREGDFCNMALGAFADESAEEIANDPDEYIRKISDESARKVVMPDGSEFTVAEHSLLWLVDGDRYLGSVSLRFSGDREVIEEFGGHIGLAIRPGLLNIGYGVKAASLAWKLAGAYFKERGINQIYVSCNPQNSASRRLIEHNGGRLIREIRDAFGTGASLIFVIDLQ
ncbi:MAG: GNAT family N-acetyltransferase [Candidatus Obscuribacterales bacterium]|nr:GNAT family N-acetyltransferase [Candidatus Obscuribacterales bacterium]